MIEVLSDTQQRFEGVTYYKCGPYFQHDGVRLHRAVWEHYHGPVPDGYHVHHIDGDRSNNDISNLACLPHSEHESYHAKQRDEYCRMHIERIRPLAAQWHGSDEGKAWHSERGKANWAMREDQTYTCDMCGNEFQSKRIYKGNHFCGPNCRAKYGRLKRAHRID